MEAAATNCSIISSNCPHGPLEFLENGKGGYIFKLNNEEDLINQFRLFLKEDDKIKFIKKVRVKKKSIQYTKFRHYLSLKNILLMS